MDSQLLTQAKKIFKELNLIEITIKDNGSEITMRREAVPTSAPALETAPVSVPIDVPEDRAYSHCKEIKSPLVGVFYAASSPDSAPFVKLGDKVKAGQTVCIIEAMKMMNEIKADHDGVVLDVCAENGNVVEYGQTLFKLA